MNMTELNLALGVFGAAAPLDGPIAAAIAGAFTAGLLIGRQRPPH